MDNFNQTFPPPASQTANNNPLPLKREESLKVFALLSFRRDVPLDILNDHKLSLSLSAAYSAGDAIMVAHEALKNLRLDPDNYKTPIMMISVDADKIIQIEPATKISGSQPEIKIPEDMSKLVIDFETELKTKKSTDDITSYILYAFDQVGTEEEKKIAEKIIKKFKTHATKNKTLSAM